MFLYHALFTRQGVNDTPLLRDSELIRLRETQRALSEYIYQTKLFIAYPIVQKALSFLIRMLQVVASANHYVGQFLLGVCSHVTTYTK
mgnify:CR=1 FL=1